MLEAPKTVIAVAAALVTVGACKAREQSISESSASGRTAAEPPALTDLSTSLEPVRSVFNARKQQARFVTLLAPT